MPEPILRVEDLTTHFFTREGLLKAVNGVSFELERGQIVYIRPTRETTFTN